MLLTTVTVPLPLRIKTPEITFGSVVDVAVLALLNPQILLFEITLFPAGALDTPACTIPATTVPTVPAFVFDIFEIVLPEIVELIPDKN